MVRPPRRTRATASIVALGAGCLAAALLAPPAVAQEAALPNHREVPNAACGQDTPQAAFPDRDAAAATHRRNIDCVAARGIAQGRDGSYRPQETVTRGQMASFVARTLEAAGHPLPAPQDQRFDDVDDSVHRDRIRQLAEVGIVRGRTADRYEPEGLVTRGQMASYLVRAASWAHDHAYQPRGDSPSFLDIEGDVHSDTIRAGYELYLYEGTGAGQYDPEAAVRRDAMSTFLARGLDLVHTGERQSTHQTWLVAPQQPVGAAAGERIELQVLGRYDDTSSRVEQSLHLALFPCAAVGTDELPATFADADADGLADGIASTDSQLAHIDTVNGQPTTGEPRLVPNAAPQPDGTLAFTVVAPAADCTVAVVFDDRAPTDELRVDALGLAANPYGIGVASWQ